MSESELLMFSGTECVHCKEMYPIVERLEAEENIQITKLEVWHNEQNAKRLQELDQGRCGGIPFFYNTKTGKWICGNTSYEKLKAWAKGE